MGSEVPIINTHQIVIDNHNPNFWVIKDTIFEGRSTLLNLADMDVKTMEDLQYILSLQIMRSQGMIGFDEYFQFIEQHFEKEIKTGCLEE